MFLQRLISGIILIVLLVSAVFFLPRPLVAIVIALIVGMGLLEFYDLSTSKGFNPFKLFGIFSGIILSVTTYIVLSYNFKADVNELILAILFLILASAFVKYGFKKDASAFIVNTSVTLLGVLYVSFLFTFIIKLRYMISFDAGKGYVISLFIITKSSDIFAYIFGMKLGKHKLIPRISAKKSVEGSIAGLLGSLLISLLLKFWFLKELSWEMAATLGLLLSVAGQAGDLIESLMKRDAQAKDSGRFVPGLGGVLDFMDSLLFTAPVMYIFMKCVI